MSLFLTKSISLDAQSLIFPAVNWLHHNGYMTALMPVSIVLTMMLIQGDPVNLSLLCITYLITIIVYSYDRYNITDEDRRTNRDRVSLLEKKKKQYPFVLAGYIAALAILVFFFSGVALAGLAITVTILIFLGILYSTALKTWTKYVPAFKNVYIAAEWGAAVVILYGIYYNTYLSPFTIVFGGFVFLKVLNTSVFFDLKDAESDSTRGLKTLPVMLGFKKTLNVLKVLSALAMLEIIIGIFAFDLPRLTLILLLFNLIVYAVIKTAELNDGKPTKYNILTHLEYIMWPAGIAAGIQIISVVHILTGS